MEKIIPLDHGYRYYIRGAMEKHLLLARSRGGGEEDTPEEPDLECFSLDVKTLQLEPACVLKYYNSVFTDLTCPGTTILDKPFRARLYPILDRVSVMVIETLYDLNIYVHKILSKQLRKGLS
uniref:Uncharacterized protein n=1 Tax=Oryza meridionalis TaxID=40149 RepID=A0A0E0ECZ9_9ORYZ